MPASMITLPIKKLPTTNKLESSPLGSLVPAILNSCKKISAIIVSLVNEKDIPFLEFMVVDIKSIESNSG